MDSGGQVLQLGMNEAPEFKVLQTPLSQKTLLRKALQREGADHLKVSELAMELTHSQTS